MKRLSLLLIFTAVLCSLICFSMNASANSAEDFDYYTDSNGGIVITYCSADGDVEIPAQIDGADVVAIDDYAFYYSTVTSVALPATVVSIGEQAFYGCTEITKIVLPDSLTTIGGMAFYDCASLSSVTISYLVSEIGDDAFAGCSDELIIYGYTGSYAEVYAGNNDFAFVSIGNSPSVELASGTCGDNLTWVIDNTNTLTVSGTGDMEDSDTFWWDYRDKIHHAVIEEGVTSIMNEAFYNCTNMESITLPSTLVSIGNYSFGRCQQLKEINFPANLKSIGSRSFEMCTSLTSAILPEGLTSLGSFTFNNCSSLTEAYIPSTVESIEYSTFYYCMKLNKVTLNKGLKSIMNCAFSYCDFESITLPDGLEMIDSYAFDYCDSLKSISIPSSVKTIGSAAFRRCTALTSANIPAGITRIESETFSDCYAVTGITIPESVTYIGKEAFENCRLMSSVEFGDYLSSIGERAFAGTAIKTVSIPARVGIIGNNAFPSTGMELIKGYDDSVAQQYAADNDIPFESLGKMPDCEMASGKCGANLEWSISTYGVLTISGEGEAYNYSGYNAAPWNEFTVKEIVIEDGITVIGQYMFDGCDKVETVEIPDSVVTIGMYAFRDCSSLKTVTLEEGLVKILAGAFTGCSSLESVQIPSTAVYIEYDEDGYTTAAFDSDTLKKVIGYDKTAAETFAKNIEADFESCGEPTEIVVVNETMGGSISWSFTNTGKLHIKSTNPAGLGVPGAWGGFNAIRELIIDDSINYLGSGLFYNCRELTSVKMSAYITEIDQYAIYYSDDDYSFTIYGYDGTAAEDYAEYMDVEFSSLGEPPVIVVDSGSCGANATWTLNTAGVLTISGSGKISDYTNPWSSKYGESIKKIVVEKGINNIPQRAFEYESFAEEIEISYTVLNIEYLPNSITLIRGYKDTAAERYANDYGITFDSLGDAPDEPVMSGSCGSDAVWSLDTSGVLTVSGSGEISNSYGNPDYWNFKDCVKKLVVEDGITSVGYNTFNSFEALEEVVLADSVTSIGMNAFSYCSALETINFPKNLTDIGSNAFQSCTALKEAKLPSTFKAINSYVFQGCSALETVTIPEGVYLISSSAFNGCSSLKQVTVPASVTSIYSGAFDSGITIYGYDETYAQTYAKNNGMTFVSLGRAPLPADVSGTVGTLEWKITTKGVMTITGNGKMEMPNSWDDFPWEDYAKYIGEVIIGEGVTSVGSMAFYNCKYLEKVTLPDSLLSIGGSAFWYCEKLADITLPEKLEAVESYAFSNTAIKKITVPQSVVFFDSVFGYDFPSDLVIYGYTGSASEREAVSKGINFVSIGVLERKVVKQGTCGDNLTWKLDNYGLLKIEGTGNMNDYSEEETAPWNQEVIFSLEVAEGVTGIGNYAFAGCYEITEASLPSSLKSIGDRAFSSCHQLSTVEIPDGTESIGTEAFFEGPYSVIVPESVTNIAEDAFLRNSYVIGNNEHKNYCSVYGAAGGRIYNYCINNGISFREATASGNCGDSATWNFDIRTGILNINGTGAIYDYTNTAIPWSNYGENLTEVKLSEGITAIGARSLTNLSVKEIKLPSTVTVIGDYAFDGCWRLTSINIPEACTAIGEYAFWYCGNLSGITIPVSVTSIADTAFDNCKDGFTVYGGVNSEAQRFANACGYNFVDAYATPVISEVLVTVSGENLEISVNGTALENKTTFVASYSDDGAMLSITKVISGTALVKAEKVDRINVISLSGTDILKPVCENVIVVKNDFITES